MVKTNSLKVKNGKSIVTKILIFVFLFILAFSFLYPIFYMLINSFKTKVEYSISAFAMPKSLNFGNFDSLLNNFNIIRYFGNTLFISAVSISITLTLSIFASYAFSKIHFRGSNFVYLLIIGTMFIPAQVTMVPMYYMFSKWDLVDTYRGVIISYIASGLPGMILLLTINFKGIPKELIEAAKIDGAGYFRIIRNVIIPMGKPIIAINVILSFVGQCNDLFTPMILLSDLDKRTVMVALTSIMSRTGGDQTYQLAGLLLSVVMPLLIYLLLQKHLVKGLTVGALK